MIPPKNDITMMMDQHQALAALPTRRRSVSSVASTTSSSSASPSSNKAGQRRKSISLPPETVEYLKNWMMSPEHIAHPYPTEREKADIMADTGIELKQLTNWFVNNRKRFWKPRVEARLQQQQGHVVQGAAATASATAAALVAASPSRTAATMMDAESTLTHVVSSPSVMALVEKAMMNMSSTGAPLSVTTQVPMVRGVVSPLNSPTKTFFSEQSSSSFDSGSVSSMEGGQDSYEVLGRSCCAPMPISLTLRSEKVDIHVLRPIVSCQEEPTLEDVVTVCLSNDVPQERMILATFQGCDLTYNVPDVADREKEQNRRDAELVRVKLQCLETFLSQVTTFSENQQQHAGMKRTRSEEEEDEMDAEPYCVVSTTRPRFRRKSIEVWKEACQGADHGFYSTSLPSLEEATKLFGYAQAN